MSDNKLVKTLTDAAGITGLAAGIGFLAKKVIKEPMTSDPSSNLMNYVKFTVVIAASLATKDYLEKQKILPSLVTFFSPRKKKIQNEMASIALMIGGAIINATTFVGGSYLAKYLSGSSDSDEEKKRHHLAVEKYQKEYEKYEENRAKLNDWIMTNDRIKDEVKQNFKSTDFALK